MTLDVKHTLEHILLLHLLIINLFIPRKTMYVVVGNLFIKLYICIS